MLCCDSHCGSPFSCARPIAFTKDGGMPDWSPEPCATCRGDGLIGSAPCEPCGGQGRVLVYKPYLDCPQCRGTGQRQKGDARSQSPYCFLCNGRGWAQSTVIS